MSGSSTAGEDIVQHLSSNSNPSSDKLAKLEARMAGKAVSAPPPSPPHHPVASPASAPTFMDQEELPESSSSDDDVSPKPCTLLPPFYCYKDNIVLFIYYCIRLPRLHITYTSTIMLAATICNISFRKPLHAARYSS
jgi:hypothetical protein